MSRPIRHLGAVAWLALAAVAPSLTACPAAAKDPAIIAGTDPGGVAVAIIGGGVDYRHPALAKRLARDGEGDLVAWDFLDSDTRPYEVSGVTQQTALAVVEAAPTARLVIVRENSRDPLSFGLAMSFLAHTPARIVHAMALTPERKDWPILMQAAIRFQNVLYLVVAGGPQRNLDQSTEYVVLSGLPNVLVASSEGGPTGAGTVDVILPDAGTVSADLLGIAARVAAATPDARDGAALKAAIVAAARQEPTPRSRHGVITEPAAVAKAR